MQQIGDKQETNGRHKVGDRRLSIGRRQAECRKQATEETGSR